MNETILEVKDLVTEFDTDAGRIRVLDHVNFSIKKGQTLGIVGESGCGKSVTSLSVMRLLPKPAGHLVKGEVILDGQDISKIPIDEMYKVRGNRIAMIFQEPMTALNPVHKIGSQLGESFKLHRKDMSDEEITQESVRLLEEVGIPDPMRRLDEYPHQLSGGIRQRVMIAIALACKPEILIADEPTTALDVTIQAQILDVMKRMQKEYGMAIMFITHDLGVIAEVCDEVVVMYAGQVIERAEVHQLFKNPRHPYTQGLLSSIPRLENTPKTQLDTIAGMVPPLTDLPPGCRFENRCPHAEDKCKSYLNKVEIINDNHVAACWKQEQLGNQGQES